jgi:predicted O-methyltransferase YrrM
MRTTLRQIGSYLGHLAKSRNRHGVHSPFVYDLIDRVLRPRDVLTEFGPIEQLREALLRSEATVVVSDLGAGSRVFELPTRRVADIARTSLKPPKQAAMLYRLARHTRARQVLELGTSFGISTLYLALGAREGTVTTVEGCPNTHAMALHHFGLLQQRNIDPVLGDFATRLPEVLDRLDRLDLVFIDGNHAQGPTLDYFEQCVPKAHNDTVFVVDDIHWSPGMEKAWEAIKAHPKVTVTIDLYTMGLVFLRKQQASEHFVLRY